MPELTKLDLICAAISKMRLLPVLLSFALWLAAPCAVEAEFIIYSGFGSNDSFDPSSSRSATTPDRGNPPADADVAQAFQVPLETDFTLESIDLAVRFVAGVNQLDVLLVTDVIGTNPRDGGQPRGEPSSTILEAFRFENQALPGIGGILHADSQLQPTLQAGMQYWLVLSVPEPNSEIAWLGAAPELAPRSVWFGERFDILEDRWIVANSPTGPGFAFRVEATPVPEPPSLALISLGIASLVAWRSRHRGTRLTRHRPASRSTPSGSDDARDDAAP